MSMKLSDYVFGVGLLLGALIGASFLLSNASNNDKELAEYSKCVDYHVTHDMYKQELKSAWGYYQDVCNTK